MRNVPETGCGDPRESEKERTKKDGAEIKKKKHKKRYCITVITGAIAFFIILHIRK